MTKLAQTEPAFPQPVYFGKNRHFKLSSLLAYEAALKGEPPPALDSIEDCYLTASQVRKRYGGVSDMWLWRRLNYEREAA